MTFPSHNHFTLHKHIFFILFIPLNNNNILNFEVISELDRIEYLESRPGVSTFNYLLYLKWLTWRFGLVWFGLAMWFFPYKHQVTCLPEMGA